MRLSINRPNFRCLFLCYLDRVFLSSIIKHLSLHLDIWRYSVPGFFQQFIIRDVWDTTLWGSRVFHKFLPSFRVSFFKFLNVNDLSGVTLHDVVLYETREYLTWLARFLLTGFVSCSCMIFHSWRRNTHTATTTTPFPTSVACGTAAAPSSSTCLTTEWAWARP